MEHVAHFLTPKQLSEAIGASESSVRRWVDSGDLRLSRTAGGHRRIPLAEAIRFIRQTAVTVVRPDLLGLGDLPQELGPDVGSGDEQKLHQALHGGHRIVARGLVLSWYLHGQSLAAIFDGPVRAALSRLGELWRHDPRGILSEHRATEICIETVAMLRGLLPQVDDTAPLAIGGGVQSDPYLLPTMMAGTVLAEVGFREVNFGADTPVELLSTEAVERSARLVWLSITTQQDFKPLKSAIAALADSLSTHHTHLVLGGRCHAEVTPRGRSNVTAVGSMSELAAFARGFLHWRGEIAAQARQESPESGE